MRCWSSTKEIIFSLNIYKCEHTALTNHDKPIILFPKNKLLASYKKIWTYVSCCLAARPWQRRWRGLGAAPAGAWGWRLPGRRRGTSLMEGRPVARLEDRGVVECTEGDAMGLRYDEYAWSLNHGGDDCDCRGSDHVWPNKETEHYFHRLILVFCFFFTLCGYCI